MSFPGVDVSACAEPLMQVPALPGAETLSLSASPVLNYTETAMYHFNFNHPTIQAQGVDFCNVTVTYTHPGQGDEVGVETWLPLSTWNGRIQSVGGGGWISGRVFLSYQGMTGAIAEGTDLRTVSLHDQAILVKALTQSFYGQKHEYAYWSGCSQGGRQGMSLSQNYPGDYDGIAAAAPAIYLTQILGSSLWGHMLMQNRGEFPPLTGWSDEAACQFNPLTLVGQSFNCSDTGRTVVVSQAAAELTAAIWAGPKTPESDFLWFGPNIDARLAGNEAIGSPGTQNGLAQTTCQNGTCQAAPTGLGDKWFPLFVQRNSSAHWREYTPESYAKLFEKGVREYDGLIGTSNPDLSRFSAAGGKMITYHGTADETIPFKQTKHYYDADADTQDFYRLFEVPGLGHCSGGNGGQPTAVWDALVAWVEKAEAPDTIPIHVKNDFIDEDRVLRPYPQRPYSS